MNRKKIIAVAIAAIIGVSGIAYGLNRNNSAVNALTSEEAKQLVAGVLPTNVSHVGTDEDDKHATFEYYDEDSRTLYEVRVDLHKGEIDTIREYPMYQELVPVNNIDEMNDRDDRDDRNENDDRNDDRETERTYDYSGLIISRDDAVAIALKEVPGASSNDVKEVELDDRDDKRPEYEVEIRFNAVKYEFEIDAKTGTIREMDIEDERDQQTSTKSGLNYRDLIKRNDAIETALKEVPGASREHLRGVKLDDRDEKNPEYEIKIRFEGVEYEFEIDAKTGTVTEVDRDRDDNDDRDENDDRDDKQTTATSGSNNKTDLISTDEAMALVLARVEGATKDNIREFKLDRDDDRPEYEGEIVYNGVKYEFEIDARNGKFVEWEREDDDKDRQKQTSSTTVAPTTAPTTASTTAPTTAATTAAPTTVATTQAEISRDRAIEIALAQVPGATTKHIDEVEFDKDDGRREWEVEIKYNGYEYDIEINAKNGQVIKVEKDRDDDYHKQTTAAPTTVATTAAPTTVATTAAPTTAASTADEITRERAIQIALAKVPGATTKHIEEVDFDYDDGRPEWEIEIEYNGYEYEIEIDGRNGNILEFDKERDD